LGSIYALNTFIPVCARRIEKRFCDKEIEGLGRDDIKDLFRESRHLGMAILCLARMTRSRKKELSLCHYMMERLARSSTFKKLLKLDVNDTPVDGSCDGELERMGSLEFAQTGCLGPNGAFVRHGRNYLKSSTIRKEKEYKKSTEMVPGVIHYLGGTCSQVVGVHVIHGRDPQSTVDIMEFLCYFFEEPPKKTVHGNAKELQLVCAMREPDLMGTQSSYKIKHTIGITQALLRTLALAMIEQSPMDL